MKGWRILTTLVIWASSSLMFVACIESSDPTPGQEVGLIDLRFENVVNPRNYLILHDAGDQEYPYLNRIDQAFNVINFKYLISEIVFEGPDSKYAIPVMLDPEKSSGCYLIDHNSPSSLRVSLTDVPKGLYNSITFRVGVDKALVDKGTDIFPLTQGDEANNEDMFWTWDEGYIAVKLEGQTPMNTDGGAFGEKVSDTNPHGFSFHMGGWDDMKQISLSTNDFNVGDGLYPEIHIVMDVNDLLAGSTIVDFRETVNVHGPDADADLEKNITKAFSVNETHEH